MAFDIDPRNRFVTRGLFCMACPAVGSHDRLPGFDHAGIYLMFFRRHVALSAFKQGVRRYRLGSCNNGVTGTAITRNSWWIRGVRIVTRDARFHWIVNYRIYLWETGRFGGAVTMT